MKRPKVGILLATKEGGKYVAHLQTRGTYDYRKGAPQTWPGINQVTVEGKKHNKEHKEEEDLHALRRELHEELGNISGEFVLRLLIDGGINKHSILLKEKYITIFVLVVPSDFFKNFGIRPENITGGFRRVTRDDMTRLVIAQPEWRDSVHPHNLNTIVVMPHVKKALQIFYKRFRSRPWRGK